MFFGRAEISTTRSNLLIIRPAYLPQSTSHRVPPTPPSRLIVGSPYSMYEIPCRFFDHKTSSPSQVHLASSLRSSVSSCNQFCKYPRSSPTRSVAKRNEMTVQTWACFSLRHKLKHMVWRHAQHKHKLKGKQKKNICSSCACSNTYVKLERTAASINIVRHFVLLYRRGMGPNIRQLSILRMPKCLCLCRKRPHYRYAYPCAYVEVKTKLFIKKTP